MKKIFLLPDFLKNIEKVKSSAAMRRQSVMKPAPVTDPPIVMDAATRSAILLTPLMKFQRIDNGAEAGFQPET